MLSVWKWENLTVGARAGQPLRSCFGGQGGGICCGLLDLSSKFSPILLSLERTNKREMTEELQSARSSFREQLGLDSGRVSQKGPETGRSALSSQRSHQSQLTARSQSGMTGRSDALSARAPSVRSTARSTFDSSRTWHTEDMNTFRCEAMVRFNPSPLPLLPHPCSPPSPPGVHSVDLVEGHKNGANEPPSRGAGGDR